MLDSVTHDPMPMNDIVRFIEDIERWEAVSYRSDQAPIERNPTWGFRFFLTSYDDEMRGSLVQAVQNLIQTKPSSDLLSTHRVLSMRKKR